MSQIDSLQGALWFRGAEFLFGFKLHAIKKPINTLLFPNSKYFWDLFLQVIDIHIFLTASSQIRKLSTRNVSQVLWLRANKIISQQWTSANPHSKHPSCTQFYYVVFNISASLLEEEPFVIICWHCTLGETLWTSFWLLCTQKPALCELLQGNYG